MATSEQGFSGVHGEQRASMHSIALTAVTSRILLEQSSNLTHLLHRTPRLCCPRHCRVCKHASQGAVRSPLALAIAKSASTQGKHAKQARKASTQGKHARQARKASTQGTHARQARKASTHSKVTPPRFKTQQGSLPQNTTVCKCFTVNRRDQVNICP
jgi:hypothetical protein